VDEAKKELFLTSQHANAVIVFRKMAEGDEPPIRLIQGDRTGLHDPHGMAIDTTRQLMFVANYGSFRSKIADPARPSRGKQKPNWPLERQVPGSGKILPPSITVHALDANGDAAPLRVITGAKTQLNWPTAVAVEPERGELFVANDMADSILVFKETDGGDVAPMRVIKGARTGLKNPTGVFLDSINRELWAANFGNHSLTVHPLTADGNAPPLRTIRTAPAGVPALMIGNPGSVTYDTKREEILVPN
jgi:DNA-binding beta-propeller fold protein YncE